VTTGLLEYVSNCNATVGSEWDVAVELVHQERSKVQSLTHRWRST
jgi:hypothetical protein